MGTFDEHHWGISTSAIKGTVDVREVGSGRKNPRRVALPAEYVGEHAHLSYAATAYGVQGATVDASHMVLTEVTSAAGVYVGMTRGREMNRMHMVAADLADARAQFIEAMERDLADRGLDHATAQAIEAVQGLVSDGPVRLVTDELARLDQEAERAQRQAERWEQIAARLDAQRAAHRAEDDEAATVLRKAEGEAHRARVEVAGPLAVHAENDGAAYLATMQTEAAARARLATTGRFGRRKARAEHHAATEQAGAARASVRATWSEPPRAPESLSAWAAQAAARRAESDPRVTDADRAVETAHAGHKATQQRHKQERLALLVSELGADEARRDQFGMRTVNAHRNAQDAHARAALARAEANELRNLAVGDATHRIEAKRTMTEQERVAAADRARRLRADPTHNVRRSGPGCDGPALGR